MKRKRVGRKSSGGKRNRIRKRATELKKDANVAK